MTNVIFDKEITALLVVDPYNDFISEGGKIWDRIKAVAHTTFGIACAKESNVNPKTESRQS
jgi:hypothetical protein